MSSSVKPAARIIPHFSLVIILFVLNVVLPRRSSRIALVLAQGLDLSVQLHQTALQHSGRVVFRTVQYHADIMQLQPGVPVGADLPKPLDIPVRVAAIIGRAATRRREQTDRFVIKNRAPAQAAAFRQSGNSQHSVFRMNPQAVDRSRTIRNSPPHQALN